MNIKITRQAQRYLTIGEAEEAREIIKAMQDDKTTPEEYAEMAIIHATCQHFANIKIFSASAEIARNGRVTDAFHKGSGKLDVWIKATAKVGYDSFVEIGVYLTDCWQLGADAETDKETVKHMFLETYEKKTA